MKKLTLLFLAIMSCNLVLTQEWLSSLSVAKRLALTQDKLLLVVWDNSANYPLPVVMENEKGNFIYFDNLFESEDLNALVWEYFIPVFVNESNFEDWYKSLRYKRSMTYLEKFADDTIKIMDANGNMLSTGYFNHNPLNFSKFIARYALDTSFMELELRNYEKKKDFYTAFYLGAKYVDFAIYANIYVRNEIIDLSDIYLNEAEEFLKSSFNENENSLKERLDLIKIKQDLLLNNTKRVIRKLRRYDKDKTADVNEPLVAFMYYTAYKLEREENNAALWKTKVSAVNLKKAELIIESLKK